MSVDATGTTKLVEGGISSLLKLGIGLLAQHTARVKGATNENSAVNQLTPQLDADVAEIASAYNSGQADQLTCIAAIHAVDKRCMEYLQSHVGPKFPGTAWSGSGTCDKGCTVGCCVYYNNIRRGLITSEGYGGGSVSLLEAISRGSGDAYMTKIFPSKFGLQAREGYHVPIKKPFITTSLSESILSLTHPSAQPLANLLGPGSENSPTSIIPGIGNGSSSGLSSFAFLAFAFIALVVGVRLVK